MVELESWAKVQLSLFGRYSLVKMVMFARLLYFMKTIPCLLQHEDVSCVTRAMQRFIWQGKRRWIAIGEALPAQE